jgi:hypothetical protein
MSMEKGGLSSHSNDCGGYRHLGCDAVSLVYTNISEECTATILSYYKVQHLSRQHYSVWLKHECQVR